jgi:transcriptional regulator with XRE-family HTH domain
MAKTSIRSILSGNLRKLRNRREWSQMELAEKADISMNFLSEIERGLKWPYPETLQNLAEALGVEVFELFRPEGEPDPGMGDYMRRFSNDVSIAVQESVNRSLQNVKKQYGGKEGKPEMPGRERWG